MNHILLLSTLFALFNSNLAQDVNVTGPSTQLTPSFPNEASCPLIPKETKSPAYFACALAGTDSCCTQKHGMLVLATQWIPNSGAVDEFTLHGLWPNTCSNGRTGDAGCDPKRVYKDMTQFLDADMQQEMTKYWPSKFGDHNSFWTHEWNKHGTCMTTLDPKCFAGNNEYKTGSEISVYFKQTLKLRQQYELYRALKKNGIVATLDKSKWKTSDEIAGAIKKEYGVNVALKCNGGVLYEVVMYFAAVGREEYVPIDVPANLRHSCGKSGSKVGLPPKKMTDTQLQVLKDTLGYDLEQVIRKDEM